MWRGKEAKKYVTSRRNFEQCENSVPMRAWFGELLTSGNIIANVWNWLAVQIREILRSKRGPKVDDERVILMKFLTSCKIYPGSIRKYFSGWKMVAESEFELKIFRRVTQNWKLLNLQPGTTNIWQRCPGAHERISPDHYFEYVETSGWNTAPWS